MNQADVIEKINSLPEHVQEQLFHYVDFLIEIYRTDPNEEELTEEGKAFLDERIKKAQDQPEKNKPWRDVVREIHEKNNWPQTLN